MGDREKSSSHLVKAIQLFEHHLFNILPLYNVSETSVKDNLVIQYSYETLARLGKKPRIDKHKNVIADGSISRAMVAHTDSVGHFDRYAVKQAIRYSPKPGIIYNRTGRRPMGADDKVGVAIALAMAEIMPELAIWLPSDEEIGCVGSHALQDIEPVDFALQFDRRNAVDLVSSIGVTKLASRQTINQALKILPHRKEVSGMSTDVGVLVRREAAMCAFNMSCGYYLPHDQREYIVYAEAIQSMMDAVRLMFLLEDADIKAPEPEVVQQSSYSSKGYHSSEQDWDNWEDYRHPNNYVGHKDQQETPSTTKKLGGEIPPWKRTDGFGWPDRVTTGLPDVRGSKVTSTNSVKEEPKKEATEPTEILNRQKYITYGDKQTVLVVKTLSKVECVICLNKALNNEIGFVYESPVCSECLMAMELEDIQRIIKSSVVLAK